MKKLLIAAAIVCAAAVSQAAQCEWGISKIGDSPDAAAATGWAAYLISASDLETFMALDADKVAGWVASHNIDQAATKTGGRGQGIIINAATGDNYGIGDSENAFIVLFDNASAADASYYAYTSTKQSLEVGDGGANIQLPFGEFASVVQGGWQSTSGGPSPIPEPTSGLLLLLGVAGMALRRKRA